MEQMEIILVEDDEEAAVSMLRFLKANVNNPIRYIQDGERALEFLLFDLDTNPKLILLDIVLPHVDGIEVYKMIKLEPKNRKIFVFFLVNDESERAMLEQQGIFPDGFLKKAKGNKMPCRIL